MALHRTRVGLHGRNDRLFTEHDYSLVRTARIETLKTMSFTDVGVYERLRRETPDLEFIVRLYDERLGRSSRPSPAEFVAKMVPTIKRLQPYATKFEIHNEPNHAEGIEGWGASDDNARAFRDWYLQVLRALKAACPWARFGFPGLALNYPHRDLEWLEICSDAIRASDWLGCHCYWQYDNMLKSEWGLRFKLYNERFPDKRLEITEFSNSTPSLAPDKLAAEHTQYYQELNKYAYLGSASSFIASSPDPAWAGFVWMKEGGQMLPVVHAVQAMPRRPVDVRPPAPVPVPAPAPTPAKEGRTFIQTGKTVRGSFLKFLDQYGLDICGYPITDQFQETGLPTQFFQRLALEEYASGKVRLKLVGAEAWYSRDKIQQLKTEVQRLLDSGTGSGSPIKPEIEDLVEKLPTLPDKPYPIRTLTEISQIVIHHTATSPTITAQRLADYQVKRLGWPGIGYHFFIAEDGRISQTNRLETVSTHAHERNQESVGICFAGTFTDVIPTAAQLRAGGQLCAWLLDLLHLTSDKIVGLCEFYSTQSPGRQWLGDQHWKDQLLAAVAAAPRAKAEDQSALIAKLQAQIKTLKGKSREGGAGSVLSEAAPASPALPGAAPVSQPAIQDLLDQLSKHPTKRYGTRRLNAIDTLVIHHTAVAASVGPQQVARYHVTNLGWPGISYHLMVSADGIIYQTNRLETVSYHTGGSNTHSVGICFMGNFTDEVPPAPQLRAGAHLVAWLIQELGLALDDVRGHGEILKIECPGRQWLSGRVWKQMLRQEVVSVQQEMNDSFVTGTVKPIYHYMLFWATDDNWAELDWANARDYVAAFRPSLGFSAHDAAQAQYVTVVGGPLGVSPAVELWLRSKGCQVDRIAGKDEIDTKRILDTLVQSGRRFVSLEG